MGATTSRRAVLGVLASAPLAVAVPVFASPSHNPEIAFNEWKAAVEAIENSTSEEVPDHLWHRRDLAEKAIDDQRGASIRAAEIGLWVGLLQMVMMADDQRAILREDLAYFLTGRAEYDGEGCMVVATIAALRKLGGR